MTAVDRALKYGVFSVIATLINLASQELTIKVYSGSYALYAALLVGTMAGLISKYCLDKKFIFAFFTRSQRHNLDTFVAYAVTGVLTTALFWGFELGSEFWFGGKSARYSGAAIGLTIGYVVKYQLDSRMVFVSATGSNPVHGQFGQNLVDGGK